MKIAYFITHFPHKDRLIDHELPKTYLIGGGERVAYNLVKELSKRGHEIYVFTTSPSYKDFVEKDGSVRIFKYGKNLKIGSTNISFKLLLEPMKYDVDIVHIHNTTAPGVIAGMIYAKKKRKPIVVTHHGAEKFSNFGSVIRRISVFLYVNFLVDKIFSYADAIICPSAYFINDSRYLKKYKEKIKIVPNGINLDAFNIPISKEECRKKLKLPSETDIILFLGALIPKKAPDILLRAMSKIVKKRSDVILILAGSGIMRENLEKLSEKMGIKNNIKFVGFVEEYLKPLYYKAADIFVLPSTMSTEVFPIVLLEASASGLPMIVSDLNTFRCIIEERYNGLFAKRKNEENLADVIIYLLENKDIQKEMGKNAKKKVRDYSWEKIAEKTEKVYTDLI